MEAQTPKLTDRDRKLIKRARLLKILLLVQLPILILMSYVTYSMFDTEDPGQQPAAEIEPMKGSSNETTWLYNGYVTEQTFEQLAGIVEETPGMKKLNFSSWGGTLSGAQKITDLLLDNGIEFTVADLGVCASACVYILTHTDPAPDAYGIYVLYTGHFSIIIT